MLKDIKIIYCMYFDMNFTVPHLNTSDFGLTITVLKKVKTIVQICLTKNHPIRVAFIYFEFAQQK
jgi:hypothetical protein